MSHAERRHRIHGVELDPVKSAVHADLLRRLRDRQDLLDTATLFRFWYRLETHCTSKPRYPPHDTWEDLDFYMSYGTKIHPLQVSPTIREASGGSGFSEMYSYE